MAPLAHESSLDRFLVNRAPALLRVSDLRTAARINLAIGGAMAVVIAALTGVAVTTGNLEVLAGVIGPFLAGGLNLSIGAAMLKKSRVMAPAEVALSPEAKVFLAGLFRDVVGWTGLAQRRRRRLLNRLQNQPEYVRRQASADVVDASVFGHLDRAASEANRVYGLLEQASATDPSQGDLIARVRHAADEAMATVLHSAAFVDRYPEASDAPLQTIEEQTRLLRELASQLPTLVVAKRATLPSGTVASPSPSRIQSVLDELNQRAIAHQELTSTEQAGEELPLTNLTGPPPSPVDEGPPTTTIRSS